MGVFCYGAAGSWDGSSWYTSYSEGPIERIGQEFRPDRGSKVTVFFRNGEKAVWMCQYLSSYAMQFGVSVSKDGEKVFVQTWEMGLLCFDSHTGERIWKTKSRRGVTTVVVNDRTLCCHRREYALQLIDIETGEVLAEKRPANSWGASILDGNHILCEVSARKWEVICTEDLSVVDTLTHNQLFLPVVTALREQKPDDDGSWCYRGASYDGSHLLIDMYWSPAKQGQLVGKIGKVVEIPYRIPEK